MKPIKVLFDTCVVIHLFNEHTELHEVAVNYYRYLKNTNNSLLVSPFSVDEYGVKDDITRIFAHGFFVPVYAIEHAKKVCDLRLKTAALPWHRDRKSVTKQSWGAAHVVGW